MLVPKLFCIHLVKAYCSYCKLQTENVSHYRYICLHLPISVKFIVEHVVITSIDGCHQTLLSGMAKVDCFTVRDLENFRTDNYTLFKFG